MSLSEEALNDGRFVTQTSNRLAQLTAEFDHVSWQHRLQYLDMFEIPPYSLIWIEIRRIARQAWCWK